MKKGKKFYKIFCIVLFLAFIAIGLLWLIVNILNKNIYFCPKGTIQIAPGECRATGVIPE